MKVEEQLDMINGLDDRRRLIFGFGFARYAAHKLLARAVDVYVSTSKSREQKVQELQELEYRADRFSLEPRPSRGSDGRLLYPSLVEVGERESAVRNYGRIDWLYRGTADEYAYMLMYDVKNKIQALISRL
ncbi:hypothetical protein PQ610_06655 [Tardisphaera miroshnichenkoae]